MRILLVTPDLDRGGAQIVMSRLAAGLVASHEVFVYSMIKPERGNLLLKNLQRSGVRVSSSGFRGWGEKIVRRLRLLQRIHARQLQNLKRKHRIQIVNSHLAAAERCVCKAFERDSIPLIGTDHGCYRALLAPVSGLGRKEDYAAIFNRSDGLICPSESNLKIAAQHSWKSGFRTWKVYYGYPLPQATGNATQDRNSEPFVFGMIARGIPEKGWLEAVRAFQRVRAAVPRPMILRLVGSGPGIDELRRNSTAEELADVDLVGEVDDVVSLLQSFDVGLLPTWFELESLPNTVIEYLAHGIPVVSTPIGGIPEMLKGKVGTAGLLVPLDVGTGKADVNHLAAAMERLATDEEFRRELSETALQSARKFELQKMIDSYTSVFVEVTRREKADIGK